MTSALLESAQLNSRRPGNDIKRVQLVVAQLNPGGAERVVVNLARTMHQAGIRVEVICLQQRGELADELASAGISVSALESMRGYDLGCILALRHKVKEFRPDVINVHDRVSMFYVAAALKFARKIPVVFSAHGLLLQDEKPQWRTRRAARALSAVTAVAQASADEYARLLGWRHEITVINNGVQPVDRDDSGRSKARRELGIAEGTFVFLAAGNIKPEKGFEDLVEAVAELGRGPSYPPMSLLIAGGQSDQAGTAALKALIARHGLEAKVRLLGSRRDMASLYSAADAFVLSSRKEGLPLVLLEAMSAGLPAVATAVGAVPTVIREGQTGRLVPPQAPRLMAQAMAELRADRDSTDRMAQAGRDYVRQHYSTRQMAENYLDVYRGCLEKMGRTGAGRPRVLMLGPMPPLTGGMATVTANLWACSLRSSTRLQAINNGKLTPAGRSWGQGILAQAKLFHDILKIVRFHRIQLVHFQSCALFTFWRDTIHLCLLRLLGVKVIWQLHDGSFETFLTGGNFLRRGLIRWSLGQARATLLLSESYRDRLAPHLPGVNLQVVGNGVPVPEMPREHEQGPGAEVSILFLGNLTKRKGAYDLLAAAGALAEAGLAFRVRLAGGEVEPGQLAQIQQAITASPARASVELLGIIAGPAKEAALAQADLVVLPSYAEGLPMALLEGMAWGKPVIATGIGSIPDLVTDGVEGFIIRPGEVPALTDCLRRLVIAPELRNKMGAAARQRIIEQFSIEAVAERILHVYQSCLT